MARINVEDSLFKDARFLQLIIETKSLDLALGSIVRCWMVGQGFWKNSSNGIPKSEWIKQGLNDSIIKCGLAEDLGDFVMVVGAAKNFAWIKELSEAGKRGGLKSHTKSSSQVKPLKPSLLSSPYSSLSSQAPNSKTNTYAQQVERIYQDYYPRKIGKTKGVKKLAREIKTPEDLASLEKAVRGYASYCQGRDKEYIKHFSTFASEWRDWITTPTAGATGGFDKERYERMLKESGLG